MRNWALVGKVGMMLLLANQLTAQIIIRDTIKITPQVRQAEKKQLLGPSAALSTTTYPSILRRVFEHTGTAVDHHLGGNAMWLSNCGQYADARIWGSVTEVSLHVKSGDVQYALFARLKGSNIILRERYYLDDVLIGQSETSCLRDCGLGGGSSFPLYNSFRLGTAIFDFPNSSINRWGSTYFFQLKDYRADNCTPITWHPNYPTSLRITRGAELGQLMNDQGQLLGDEFMGSADEIAKVRFIADGIQPQVVQDTVVIEASSRGIVSQWKVVVEGVRLRLRANSSSVEYGRSVQLEAQAITLPRGWNVSLPSSITYSFEIAGGKEWGSLRHGSQSGDVITGVTQSSGRAVVWFDANETEPMQNQTVKVRVQASDGTIPGDSTTFTVQPKFIDGVLELVIADTIKAGRIIPFRLRSYDEQGREFFPLDDDEAFVETLSGEQWAVYMRSDGSEEIGRYYVWDLYGNISRGMYGLLAKPEEGSTPREFETMSLDFFAWGENFFVYGEKQLVIDFRKSELDHFAVTVVPDTIEHSKSATLTVIAQDASNNEVTIEGNTPLTFTVDKPEYGSIEPVSSVTYAVARAGGVRYLANGTNPLTPQHIGITVTGAGKSGSGSVVVNKKAETELVITAPTEDQEISREPRMPKPIITAQLKNYNGGQVLFKWKMTIEWTGRGGWKTPRNTELYDGQAEGVNSQVADLRVNLDRYLRGGQKVTLGVEAVGQNVHKEKALANPFRIVGLNPTKTVAKQYLGDLQYQVVAYKESRFRQFGIDHDFPLQGGDPNDIGMMQVNNPTDDDQIWHWKRNADAGKRIFDQKYSLAQRYHVDLQNGTVYRDHPVMEGWYGSRENPTRYAATPLDDNQRVLDGFQRYNRGVFYRWIPNNPKKDPAGSGKWIAEPRNNYGNEAWDIYNGNLPSDWND